MFCAWSPHFCLDWLAQVFYCFLIQIPIASSVRKHFLVLLWWKSEIKNEIYFIIIKRLTIKAENILMPYQTKGHSMKNWNLKNSVLSIFKWYFGLFLPHLFWRVSVLLEEESPISNRSGRPLFPFMSLFPLKSPFPLMSFPSPLKSPFYLIDLIIHGSL